MLENLLDTIFEPIHQLKGEMCFPYTLLDIVKEEKITSDLGNIKNPYSFAPYFLNTKYNLKELLKSSAWLDNDIEKILTNKIKNESSLGRAFSTKYENIDFEDDARSIIPDWTLELKNVLNHVSQNALKGHLLHVGSDSVLEPKVLHYDSSKITLVNISKKLVDIVPTLNPNINIQVTPAEILNGIGDNSIDFYVALRVYNSVKFNQQKSIKRAKKVLKKGGSILLSVSNGYRALDNTILPGEIMGTPPKINLAAPFQHALNIITLLFEEGFRELFLVPGGSEIFFGGTLLSETYEKNSQPILHTEGIDNIPLCFYSEKMPTSWLGNFSNHSIFLNEKVWPTVEHFFQSEKFSESYHKEKILSAITPGDAKKYAWLNSNDIRSDWEEIRISTMKNGLIAKFNQHNKLKIALKKTLKRELIEISNFDDFWGKSIMGIGENRLGVLLMQIRKSFN